MDSPWAYNNAVQHVESGHWESPWYSFLLILIHDTYSLYKKHWQLIFNYNTLCYKQYSCTHTLHIVPSLFNTTNFVNNFINLTADIYWTVLQLQKASELISVTQECKQILAFLVTERQYISTEQFFRSVWGNWNVDLSRPISILYIIGSYLDPPSPPPCLKSVR